MHDSTSPAANTASNAQAEFKPWKRDFHVSFFWLVLGLAILGAAITWYLDIRNPYVALAGMVSVAPFYVATLHLEKGQKRKHGKNVEKAALEAFAAVMPEDWHIMPERMLDSGGDIDLPLCFPNGERCVVEIKSWHGWTGFFRTYRARAQVYRQRYAVKAAYGVIWLPHAKPAFSEFHGGIFVVGGRARYLVQNLQGMIRYDAVIKFPRQPSEDIRRYISSAMRFRWNPEAMQWEGKCSTRDADAMRGQIADEGGVIVLAHAPSTVMAA